jgi:hypothetical protein
VTPGLAREVARLLQQPPGTAETALERALAGLASPPPLAELLEVGARARRARASDEELLLAVGTLLALHAPPAGSVGRPV